jgi:hypothetical protein
MATSFATTLRNARALAIVTEAGAGAKIRFYTAAYSVTLGTLTCAATLGNVTNGILTFNAITSDTAAAASGVFALARIYKADGLTMVMEGLTVGTTGTNIIMNAASSVAGATIAMSSAVITEGNI